MALISFVESYPAVSWFASPPSVVSVSSVGLAAESAAGDATEGPPLWAWSSSASGWCRSRSDGSVR